MNVDDLPHHLAEVLERVATGKKFEVVRDGVPVAVIGPPDVTEMTLEGLIKGGIVEPDWQERQAQLLQYLRERPLPVSPNKRSLSEVLIEMREEETR